MPGQDDIHNQQSLLEDHRRTLVHALRQAAAYGGLAFAPAATANSIYQARADIRRIKEILRGWGDYTAARRLFERALTICEQARGPQHPYRNTTKPGAHARRRPTRRWDTSRGY